MVTSTHGLTPDDLVAVLGDRSRTADALEEAFRRSDRTSFLERSAFRIAQLLKSELTWPDGPPAAGSSDQATTDFVEQWVIDVGSMNDATVASVRELLGDDGLMNFVHSVLVIEQRIRLDLAWQHLGFLSAVEAGSAMQASRLARWGAESARLDGPEHALIEVPSCDGRIASGRHGDQRLTAALSEWQAAVVCLDKVDPVTTELVRLRCANYHDCHT